MPSPLGHEKRDRKFLLRMTAAEDDYMRSLAHEQRTSLNDSITGLIRDRIAADAAPPPAAPAPAPAKPPAKQLPARGRGARRPTVSTAERARTLLPPPLEDRTPGPGQTAITDDDQ